MPTECEVCSADRELTPDEVKKLKANHETLGIILAVAVMLFLISLTACFMLFDSMKHWRSEYYEMSRKSHRAELVSLWGDSKTPDQPFKEESKGKELIKLQNGIFELKLAVSAAESKVKVCQAERGMDIAQYEYRLLQEKNLK